MSKTTALHVYHAFYYIPLTSTTKGSVLHNTGAWFPLVALELFTGYIYHKMSILGDPGAASR